MNAIILCGGLSTRLGEITKSIPKVLLNIKGKTVLEWQIKKLKSLGIAEVVLAAGHLNEVLREMVGESLDGVKLIYAIEPEKLGTGGAIKYAWGHAPKQGEPVIVLNGDILTTVDFQDMVSRLRADSDGLILGSKVSDAATYGTLEYDENFHLKKFKEKEGLHQPGFINGGIYIFNHHAQKYFPSHNVFSIEYDVFPNVTNLRVYESEHPWIDIGLPERLQWARDNWEG